MTACKWDSIIPLEPMWEQLKRAIKPSGAVVMTASRRWILIEREEKYCEIIAKRLDAEAISRRNKQPSLLDSVES